MPTIRRESTGTVHIDNLSFNPFNGIDPVLAETVREVFSPVFVTLMAMEKVSILIEETDEPVLLDTFPPVIKRVSTGWRMEIEEWQGYHVKVVSRGLELEL